MMKLINRLQAIYNRIPRIIRNKYSITLIVFIVFIVFFDNHNVIRQISLQRELNNIREEVNKYNEEYKADKILLQEIKRDRSTLKRIGRERYLMHYPDDEVYYFK